MEKQKVQKEKNKTTTTTTTTTKQTGIEKEVEREIAQETFSLQ